MTDSGQSNHLVPQTLWDRLYLGWFLVCFFMIWVGTWAVNEPVAVLGMPLVYAWCSGWGIVWLIGCLCFGLKIEQARELSRGD